MTEESKNRNAAFVAVLSTTGSPLWATLSSNPSRVESSMKAFQGEADQAPYEIHKVFLYRAWPDADGAVRTPPRYHVMAYSIVKKGRWSGQGSGKVLKRTYLTTSQSTLAARFAQNQEGQTDAMSLSLAQSLGLVDIAYFHARVTGEKVARITAAQTRQNTPENA